MNNGTFGGGHLVSEAAVVAARTRVARDNSTPSCSQGWWARAIAAHDMYFAWRRGGQFIYVIPGPSSVLVITQSTSRGNERSILVPSSSFT